jgi:hypothetical protein
MMVGTHAARTSRNRNQNPIPPQRRPASRHSLGEKNSTYPANIEYRRGSVAPGGAGRGGYPGGGYPGGGYPGGG